MIGALLECCSTKAYVRLLMKKNLYDKYIHKMTMKDTCIAGKVKVHFDVLASSTHSYCYI